MDDEILMKDEFQTNLEFVYKIPEGKKVLKELWNMYVICPLLYQDPSLTSYQVGKRDVILDLFKDLNLTEPSNEENHD